MTYPFTDDPPGDGHPVKIPPPPPPDPSITPAIPAALTLDEISRAIVIVALALALILYGVLVGAVLMGVNS